MNCTAGDEHAEQTLRPTLPEDPRGRVIAAANAIHDSLAAWPGAAEILTADGFLGRLGESALWAVETIVVGAIDHGCTPEQAVDVFRSLWYYTVGEILVRAHSDRRRARVEESADTFFSGLDTSRLPRLSAFGDQWPALASRETYPQGLEAFVDGLLTQAMAVGRA
ncbi:hypothetical protein ABIA32_002824 [Streptacidiphilus sp. MAP12-20]|uniref:TetR/AcrR family transcriptional regulator C-terminal domain-containing protein n=1 Tax=Streptacidiphilus sp. MAP12-20 TaxID=3156299 RepID=UPI003518719A